MPKEELHTRKKYKNYALCAILFGLVVLFYITTLIKLGS